MFRSFRDIEKDLQERSIVGTSEFEREHSWAWTIIMALLVLAGAAIKRWLF